MQLISKRSFDKAYELLNKSFSKGELRTYDNLLSLYEEGSIQIYTLNNTLDAICVTWKVFDYEFIEYLCVHPSCQGMGLGSHVLSFFKDKKILLEVSEIEDEISRKRVAFYKRNGYYYYRLGYTQPALHEVVNTHQLHLMSYPKEIDIKEYENIRKEIFSHVYGVKE